MEAVSLDPSKYDLVLMDVQVGKRGEGRRGERRERRGERRRDVCSNGREAVEAVSMDPLWMSRYERGARGERRRGEKRRREGNIIITSN